MFHAIELNNSQVMSVDGEREEWTTRNGDETEPVDCTLDCVSDAYLCQNGGNKPITFALHDVDDRVINQRLEFTVRKY
jgi:hypothetical protein